MHNRIELQQLSEIRRNTDWKALFIELGIEKDIQRSTPVDWWGKSPFRPKEHTASFHINEKGWYCHSTGQGGGPFELVQKLHGVNCYEAAKWLLEKGISTLQEDIRGQARGVTNHAIEATATNEVPQEIEKHNEPIRQDLTPLLIPSHPEFTKRGIPETVLKELGIGYLPATSQARTRLKGQIIFQIRGVRPQEDGTLSRVILSHMGRAVAVDEAYSQGKWHFYKGFHSGQELYNLDNLLLDKRAEEQVSATGQVLIVEGCFDLAKLYGAEIRNVVATFGCHLTDDQLSQVTLISDNLRVNRFMVFYDRDQDGKEINRQGALHTVEKLQSSGYEAAEFDWNQHFRDRARGSLYIPSSIKDPCDFTLAQLRWLREKGRI